MKAGVLTVSDGCARGEREDVSGRILAETLEASGFEITARAVVSDDAEVIIAKLIAWCDADCDVILTTGGTGFSPRDITPEATRSVIERDAPGLAELLRWTGYQKLPRAVLSRGVAGIRGSTLLINLPGSTGGVRDGLEVLLPLLPHAIAILRDAPTDHSPGKPTNDQRPNTKHQTPNTNAPASVEVQRQTNPPATVAVLEVNLDDFSPEMYELLMERLFETGALDVFLTPIQMKKQRPGTLLTVLAPVEKREEIASLVFRETTTFGIRHTTWERYTLERRWETVETPYGPIRIKIGTWRGVETTASPEYEDVKAAARAHNVPVKTVYQAAQVALTPGPSPSDSASREGER